MSGQEFYSVALPYVLWKSPHITVLYRLMGGELFRVWDGNCFPKAVSVEYESNNVAVLHPDGTLQIFRAHETETIPTRIHVGGEERVNAIVVNGNPIEVFYTELTDIVRLADGLVRPICRGEIYVRPISVTRAGRAVGWLITSGGTIVGGIFGGTVRLYPQYSLAANLAPAFPHWVPWLGNTISRKEVKYYVRTFDETDLQENRGSIYTRWNRFPTLSPAPLLLPEIEEKIVQPFTTDKISHAGSPLFPSLVGREQRKLEESSATTPSRANADRTLGEITFRGEEKVSIPFVHATMEEDAAIVSFPFLGGDFVTAIYNNRNKTPCRAYVANAIQMHIEVCPKPYGRYHFYIAPRTEDVIHVFDSNGDYCRSYILKDGGIIETVSLEFFQESNYINEALQEGIGITTNTGLPVLAALLTVPEHPLAQELRKGPHKFVPNAVEFTFLQ